MFRLRCSGENEKEEKSHRERIRRILNGLREKQWNIAIAESSAGGQLAADLTESVPGASDVVAGSAVCYQLEAKRRVLGLTEVEEWNVVSDTTAWAMAGAARRVYNAHVGVGTTGYLDGSYRAYWAIQLPLSPGGDPTAIATTLSGGYSFDPDLPDGRATNRRILVNQVLDMLDVTLGLKG